MKSFENTYLVTAIIKYRETSVSIGVCIKHIKIYLKGMDTTTIGVWNLN